MPKRFWKSLRSRILLLAVLTFLFLAGAAFSFFAFLRSSHTATLSAAERHLITVASGLARNYDERPDNMPSLSSVELPPAPSPPPPRPHDPTNQDGPPPPPPRPSPRSDPLSALTARALRQETGIEGGFFAGMSGVLTGYAFPTHEGPGPSKEMPQRERPIIEKLAREAVATASTKTSRFEGPHDAVLFIIMTAHGTGPNAMQAMQLGAYDFITKPLDMDQALATVARALRHMELQREVEQLRERRFRDQHAGEEDFDGDLAGKARLIGNSPAWIEVFKSIGRVAHTDVGVLLLGESGTGKEVVARTIHENSTRSKRPFTVVNCAALPADLLESELFGHERGAFTSAVAQKPGKFEAANGGTVFLDEVGELPLSLQPKLLRVLQERTFERVGGNITIHVDIRIVAATNRALEEEVEEKTFRQDLFYRLNAYTLRLPPLRERRNDILPLAEHFLRRYAERNGTPAPGLTQDAMVALQQYAFPGNVRELEHLMERISVQAGGRAITGAAVDEQLETPGRERIGVELQILLDLPFHESVAKWEQRLIGHAMEASGGNKSVAARRLGIHRRLLYEKLQQFGIS